MATSTTKSGAKKSAATKKKATKKKASAATKKKAAAEKEPVTKKAAATKTAAKKAPAKKAPAKKAAAKEAAPKAPKLTAPPKPPKTPFDKKFLDEVRALLLEERARYVKSADTLKAEADSLVEGREPGDVQFDEESGDGDTVAVERERDLALSAAARAAVQEIDDALARIDAGTYGVCTGSGKPIPKERLRAIPWATQRVEVKAGGFGIR